MNRGDRAGLIPLIVLDASIISIRNHIPPDLPEEIPASALCVPGHDIPLFQSIDELITSYTNLSNLLLNYHEVVMEQVNELQRRYLEQVNFEYASSITNVHFDPPEYRILGGDSEETMTVHGLRQSNDIGKLKRLKAQVIHTGGTNTTVLLGAFRCSGSPTNPCGAVTYIDQDPYDDILKEPTSCSTEDEVGGCGRKKGEVTFNLLNKPDSVTTPIQMLLIQKTSKTSQTQL